MFLQLSPSRYNKIIVPFIEALEQNKSWESYFDIVANALTQLDYNGTPWISRFSLSQSVVHV